MNNLTNTDTYLLNLINTPEKSNIFNKKLQDTCKIYQLLAFRSRFCPFFLNRNLSYVIKRKTSTNVSNQPVFRSNYTEEKKSVETVITSNKFQLKFNSIVFGQKDFIKLKNDNLNMKFNMIIIELHGLTNRLNAEMHLIQKIEFNLEKSQFNDTTKCIDLKINHSFVELDLENFDSLCFRILFQKPTKKRKIKETSEDDSDDSFDSSITTIQSNDKPDQSFEMTGSKYYLVVNKIDVANVSSAYEFKLKPFLRKHSHENFKMQPSIQFELHLKKAIRPSSVISPSLDELFENINISKDKLDKRTNLIYLVENIKEKKKTDTKALTNKRADLSKSPTSNLKSKQDKSIKVFYQFNSETKTIKTDFHCPFCSLRCVDLDCLSLHLASLHHRFKILLNGNLLKISKSAKDLTKFSFPTQDNDITIFVVYLDENFDSSYCGDPNDYNTATGLAKSRFKPIKRYKEPLKSVYYHSKTNLPLLANDLDIDSADEMDSDFLKEQIKSDINEFVDVNAGEKLIMILWNFHCLEFNSNSKLNPCLYISDSNIYYALKSFVESKHEQINNLKIFNNFLMHLGNLLNLKKINADQLKGLVELYDEKVRSIQINKPNEPYRDSSRIQNQDISNTLENIDSVTSLETIDYENMSPTNTTPNTDMYSNESSPNLAADQMQEIETNNYKYEEVAVPMDKFSSDQNQNDDATTTKSNQNSQSITSNDKIPPPSTSNSNFSQTFDSPMRDKCAENKSPCKQKKQLSVSLLNNMDTEDAWRNEDCIQLDSDTSEEESDTTEDCITIDGDSYYKEHGFVQINSCIVPFIKTSIDCILLPTDLLNKFGVRSGEEGLDEINDKKARKEINVLVKELIQIFKDKTFEENNYSEFFNENKKNLRLISLEKFKKNRIMSNLSNVNEVPKQYTFVKFLNRRDPLSEKCENVEEILKYNGGLVRKKISYNEKIQLCPFIEIDQNGQTRKVVPTGAFKNFFRDEQSFNFDDYRFEATDNKRFSKINICEFYFYLIRLASAETSSKTKYDIPSFTDCTDLLQDDEISKKIVVHKLYKPDKYVLEDPLIELIVLE